MHAFELVVVAVWLLALVTTLLNLLLVGRLRAPADEAAGGDLPLVSVIVPARDEERAIAATVAGFLAQDYPRLELIVVNDRSVDRTEAILRLIAGSDPRLRVVHGEEPPPGWLGKPWAVEQGSVHAAGELILFVDADVHYRPGAVRAMVARLHTSGVAMVSILPDIRMRGFWENAAMPMLAFAGLVEIPTWLGNRTKAPLLAIGGGTGMLVTRAAFHDVGGYAVVRDAVVDDIGFARALREAGHRTEMVLGHDQASVRMYHGGAEVVRGFTKNLFAGMRRNYAIAVFSIAAMIAFHIAPYLLALRGDRLAILSVAIITATRLILFASLRYPLWNALLLHPVMTAVWIWICLRSMWQTGFRNQLHWRGRSYGRDWSHYGRKR